MIVCMAWAHVARGAVGLVACGDGGGNGGGDGGGGDGGDGGGDGDGGSGDGGSGDGANGGAGGGRISQPNAIVYSPSALPYPSMTTL